MPAKNHSSKYSTPHLLEIQPFPPYVFTQSPWKSFLRENGYANLSKTLKLKVYSNLADAKKLWEEFSSNTSVFDLWDVRSAFYSGYECEPYFLSLLQESSGRQNILGVLPLWYNINPTFGDAASDCRKYVWFGSNWPEDNIFFVQNEEIIPLLLASSPKPLELACIRPLPQYQFLENFPGYCREEDKKYFLDLSKVSTLDDFLSHLKKKKRYNLRRDKKHIRMLHPTISVNGKDHLEEMFDLSIRRFRAKYPDNPDEYSAFEDEKRRKVFRSLVANAKDYQVRLITTCINDKVEAVEFGLVYNKTYYAFNAGVDISHFSGLGVFSNLLVIEDALKLGCTKIDFLESDNNWKESWHLDFLYQYQFTK